MRQTRRDVLADNCVDLLEHRVNRNSVATGDIEHFTCNAGCSACEQIGLNYILHVGEVTGLKTVPVDLGLAALEHSRNEKREHSTILRRPILPRAEHVEIA